MAEDVLFRFRGDSAGLRRAASDVDRSLGQLQRSAAQVTTGMGEASTRSRSHLAALGGAAAMWTKRATIGFSLVGAGGAAMAGKLGLNFFNVQQQGRIAFETMLGSAQKAEKFLSQLATFAAKTPFEFPALVQTTQKLLAMGFSADEVIPKLTAIGDAVAGLGGSAEMLDRVTRALGQMLAKGRVSAEEMMQLTEAGIPAWRILAEALGTDVAGAMDKVQKRLVDSRTAVDALAAGMEKRFGGMMAQQAKTMMGLWSTLKDTIAQVTSTALGPFFEMAMGGMTKLIALTNTPEFKKRINEMGKAVKANIADAIEAARGVWERNGEAIKSSISDIATALWDLVSALKPVLLGLGGALLDGLKLAGPAISIIAKAIAGLLKPINSVAEAIGGWKVVIETVAIAWVLWKHSAITSMLAVSMASSIHALNFARAWRTALIATGWGAFLLAASLAFTYIMTHWDKVKRYFKASFVAIVELAKGAFGGLLQIMLAPIRLLLMALSNLPFGMGGPFKKALRTIDDFLGKFKPDFSKIAEAASGGGKRAGEGFVSGFAATIGGPFGLSAVAEQALGATSFVAEGAAGAKAMGKGQQFGVVAAAQQFGVGSGGVYKTGGGHTSGAAVKPGTALDCSGYVYQVFLQNGFEGFPGTSETQWATKSGSNWTSVIVNPSEARPGDVVFSVGSPKYKSPGHVGIIVSGSGLSAVVMQYSQTNMPANTVRLSQIGDLVGIKRFYLVKKSGEKKGTKKPEGETGEKPSVTALTPALEAELTLAKSIPGVAGLRRVIEAEEDAVAFLAKRAAKLKKGSTDWKLIQAAINEHRQNIRDARKAIKDAQAEAIAPAMAKGQSIADALAGLLNVGKLDVPGLLTQVGDFRAQMMEVGGSFSPAVDALLVKLTGLYAKLQAAIKAGSVTAIRAITKSVTSVAQQAVALMMSEMTSVTWKAEDAQVALDRAMGDVVNGVMAAFDKATQAYEEAWNEATSNQLEAMRKAREVRISALREDAARQVEALQVTVRTAWGSFRFGGGISKTPAEQMLEEIRKTREVADRDWAVAEARRKLAEAQVSGNARAAQEAARELQAAITAGQEEQLQSRADSEREAADSQLDAARDALQKRLDLEIAAEEERLAAQEVAYQKERDGQLRSWQEQRLNERKQMDESLQDWQRWINQRRKAWDDFLQYVKDTWGYQYSGGFPGAGAETPVVPYFGENPRLIIPSGRMIMMQHGGVVPGTYLGRQDTVAALLTPGEEVIPRGGGRTIVFAPQFTFQGHVWDERELMRKIRDGLLATSEWQVRSSIFGGRG